MTYEDATGRCWLEVDLDAILENHRAARVLMGPDAAVVPVLKADAYGMGAAVVGRLLADDGARLFAVATGDEAEQLMRALPGDAKVLTMGLVGRAQMVRLIRAGMPLTLFSERQGMSIAEAARAAGEAAWVHVKVDTGLHRLGLAPETAADGVAELMQTGVIRVAGLYTHLAIHTAETDRAQTAKLREVRAAFLARDIDVPMTHAVDSIGMARYPEDHMDAARAGAWLYGVAPAGFDRPALCRGAARFKARVAQLRYVRAGELVGYDDEHPLPRDSLIATLSAGYADGFPRLAHGQDVEIRGARAKAVGIACMDQMMADVGGVPGVEEGDEVTFVGGIISVDEYAKVGRLNRNEAWARIGRRVPRVYFVNGRPAFARSEVNPS